ncbi:MAG: hypothetical protein CBHOC_2317 [uncultured Caballeronia sp.]|nr:MAG: hypothetical protein CBHOC_2317 [uncultured Caballeronia sp.]
MVTRYGHSSSRILVHAGDYVMPGQEIAEVGSTGRSTGPHLHFEVIVGGAQINPAPIWRCSSASRMRKVDSKRLSLQLTRQNYSLTPRRNTGIWLGSFAAACALAALVAAGFALKRLHEDMRKLDALCAPPASEQKLREQLVRAQFALVEQEATTRAVLEQRMTETTAQNERLQTDLTFLKKTAQTRLSAPTRPARTTLQRIARIRHIFIKERQGRQAGQADDAHRT